MTSQNIHICLEFLILFDIVWSSVDNKIKTVKILLCRFHIYMLLDINANYCGDSLLVWHRMVNILVYILKYDMIFF